MKETSKEYPFVTEGLKALAQLEEAIKLWEKYGKNCRSVKEGLKNMEAIRQLIEKVTYATEEDMEKHYEEWVEEMSLRCNAMIGTMILAQQEMQRRN